jgi:hypothetical protein
MQPRRALPALIALSCVAPAGFAAPPEPEFQAETLDESVDIGYGVTIGDVDGDGRDDVILIESETIAWYRNPGWERFVIARDLTERDHVCITARDINGDGQVELAAGAQWNPGNNEDLEQSGALFYLQRPDDPTSRWEPVRIQPHEPTIHRIRWMETRPGRFELIVLPLRARPDAPGVRVDAYRPVGDDPTGNWKRTRIDGSMHLTHNMMVTSQAEGAEQLFVIGEEGVRHAWVDGEGNWRSRLRQPGGMDEGGGEIQAGAARTELHRRSLPRHYATVEPMHGHKLVHYALTEDGEDGQPSIERTVLDRGLNQGHAVGVADLLGLGSAHEQVVAGWRQKNDQDQWGVKLHVPHPGDDHWHSYWIDRDMACENMALGDLDQDGRPDVVASGRATENLKVYWNRSGK